MLRNPKGIVRMDLKVGVLNMQPIFCWNCGANGGYVPEDVANCPWASYICDDCAVGLAPILAGNGYYIDPMESFWAKVNAAQMEADGRILAPSEIAEALKDSTHYLSKLAAERDSFIAKRSLGV